MSVTETCFSNDSLLLSPDHYYYKNYNIPFLKLCMLLSFPILLMYQDVCSSSRHQVLAIIKYAGSASLMIFNSNNDSLNGNGKARCVIFQDLKFNI